MSGPRAISLPWDTSLSSSPPASAVRTGCALASQGAPRPPSSYRYDRQSSVVSAATPPSIVMLSSHTGSHRYIHHLHTRAHTHTHMRTNKRTQRIALHAGLFVSLSTFLFIRSTNPLTYNFVGHLKTVSILTAGWLFFHEDMNYRKVGNKTDRDRDRDGDGQTDHRQTGRRHAGRQTDGQTHRHTDTQATEY